MSEIYSPEEDSYLMSNYLEKTLPELIKKNLDLKFLEIGAGSGIILNSAFNSGIKKENILGTDINLDAVKTCKKEGFQCVFSNLFDNIKGKFDIITFNPPYLPLDRLEPKDSRIITTGGKKGDELIIKFLKQAKNYLRPGGVILLITSSLSNKTNIKKFGYTLRELDSKKLFFEKITLWELKLKPFL
ncbi:methyltransferase [Patescibacteria group bacterium]|nr:methyltransferase [Patescibacteria group bacterium]